MTCLAPETRDIVWMNMTHSRTAARTRQIVVLGLMLLIFFFWVFPIAALASLLSYQEIKKTMPWLGRLIDSNEEIRAIVQNVLPSVAMISLNALLPFIFEGWYSNLLMALMLITPFTYQHSHISRDIARVVGSSILYSKNTSSSCW